MALTRPFWLGVYEVTQEQYQRVMGKNPSHFSRDGGGKDQVKGMDTSRFPVEGVSWEDAVLFCGRLSELPAEKAAGRVYRLPTEAEWEYACRAGASDSRPFYFGREGVSSLSARQANFDGDFPYGGAPTGDDLQRPVPVGNYDGNRWGLYDMHGNVWEWCADWYDEKYHVSSPREDPPGPLRGPGRVFRGGGWSNHGRNCRSAYRNCYAPDGRNDDLGFRVASVPSVR